MTLYMKADIREQWMNELRSGNYKQGAGELHRIGYPNSPVEADRDPRFCCLGILCEMAVKAGVVSGESRWGSNVVSYGASSETAYLPQEVVDWAGLKFEGDRVITDAKVEEARGYLTNGTRAKSYKDSVSLSRLNDNGTPFDEIAEVIKTQVIPV